MAQATRIYVVGKKGSDDTRRLVKASSQAQAMRHVAKDVLWAGVATQDDLVALAPTVKVEEAA